MSDNRPPGAGRYHQDYREFLRQSPRVYGQKKCPGDADDDLIPATATAMVEEPPKAPNPYTIEGMIDGFGKIGTSAAHGDQRARAMAGTLVWLWVIPMLLVLFVGGGITLVHLLT